MRTNLILAALASVASALPAQWAQTSPSSAPSNRRAGAMTFFPGNNRLVLYGGLTATPAQANNETWTYNGQWSQVTASAPARWGHRMVADTQAGRLITFGGRSPLVTTLANDTWQFASNTWTQIPTAHAPAARLHYGLAYDSARNRVVLFGGRTAQTTSAETWEFDGTDWSLMSPPNAPPAREEMAMVYDAEVGAVVLFGGCNETTGQVFGDTWRYDGGTWTELQPASAPLPRFRAAMAYDSDRRRSVLFGGYDGTVTFSDTFELIGDTWTPVATAMSPPNNTETFHGYDAVRDRFVVFGGFSTTFTNETWEYDGADTGLFSLYGDACPLPTGTPTLSGTTPALGQTLTLTIDDLGSSFGAVWVLGLSDTTYLGLPLPLDLAVIGLPGCDLLASPDVLEIAQASNGSVTYSLPVPSQSSLLFASLYVQGVAFDIAPQLTWLGTTRGGRALIGN